MQYTWDARCAFELASLPKAAAAQMKLANALQLRVLIWLACVGQGRFDAAACAVACGETPEMCEEALHHWVQRGVVSVEGVASPTVTVTAPPAQTAATPPPVTLPEMPCKENIEEVVPPIAPEPCQQPAEVHEEAPTLKRQMGRFVGSITSFVDRMRILVLEEGEITMNV